MNWRVTVQTEELQIIEVSIHGYIQREDAIRAALGQTGAKTVLYAMPDYSQEKKTSSKDKSSSSYNLNYENDFNEVEAYLLIGAALSTFVGVVASPIFSLSIILYIATFAHYFIRKIKEELF